MRLETWQLWAIVAPVMAVPMIYLFQFHKVLLLERRGGARVTSGLFLSLAALGVVLAARQHFDRRSLAIAAALVSPELHRILFRNAHRWFVKTVGREPQDVAFNWDRGLAPDRFFAIVIMMGCIFGSMAMIGYFLWNLAA